MTGRSASRRTFLGAAGVAAVGGVSLDPARADAAGGGGTAAPAGRRSGRGPRTARDPGTLTKTFMFSDAQGFGNGVVSPLAWLSGGYQPGGGFIDLALGLDAGAIIKRVDVYVPRGTPGSVSVTLNRASVTVSRCSPTWT